MHCDRQEFIIIICFNDLSPGVNNLSNHMTRNQLGLFTLPLGPSMGPKEATIRIET